MPTTLLKITPLLSKFPSKFLRGSALGAAMGASVLLFTSCSSTPPPDPMAEAAGEGERPVAMTGASSFFDGKIAATVTISRGFSRDLSGKADGAQSRRERKRRGEEDATNTGISDSYPMSTGSESESEQREMYEDMVRLARARRAAGSPMPPVTIRLKLENRTGETLDVDLLEVNSDLGNFAVRPTKLSLAAAQTGETEPMVSQLGVTSDEIPMKVALRIAGKKELQVIPVKSVFTAIEKKK
ncbi:MAG TPA: hypothetical protein VHO24_04350 [Opitutaceae bacterium]|nr:hypothetical protein [Opitutaceae bacterium]